MFSSCDNSNNSFEKTGKSFEGRIFHEISYPYNVDDPLLNLYPTKMISKIKKNFIHSRIDDFGITIDTYIDLNKKEMDQYIEMVFPYKKYHIHLDSISINNLNNTFPKYSFDYLATTDSIALCLANKIQATPIDKKKSIIEIWSTKDLIIENYNFFGAYSSIKDPLLNFEIKSLGIDTRLTTVKIEHAKINADFFNFPKGYEEISYSDFHQIMAKTFQFK